MKIEELRELYSKNVFEFYDYVFGNFSRVDAEQVILRLLGNLHSCDCENEFAFKEWARSWLRNECADEMMRREFARLPMGDLAAVLPKRKGTKKLVYEIHDDRLFVQIPHPRDKQQFLIWILESECLDWAKCLWPVHAKHAERIGWYLVKSTRRQLRNGKWFPCDVGVHNIFVGALPSEHVIARDGSYLNFYDNLTLVDGKEVDVTNPDASPQACQLDIDVSNLVDWRPAKATPTRETEPSRTVGVDELRRAWGFARRPRTF